MIPLLEQAITAIKKVAHLLVMHVTTHHFHSFVRTQPTHQQYHTAIPILSERLSAVLKVALWQMVVEYLDSIRVALMPVLNQPPTIYTATKPTVTIAFAWKVTKLQ